jgi:cytochrome c-type biogenesis protein CcmH
MKLLIDKKLNEGLNETEIYEFLQIKYGDWINYDPELNEKTFILWGLPILLFILGGAIIFRKLIVLK